MNGIERIRETAEWAVKEIDPEGSWSDGQDWWTDNQRLADFIGDADPHTIIAWAKVLLLADKALGDWTCGNCENVDDRGDCQPIHDVPPDRIDTRTCEHCIKAVRAYHAIAKLKEES